MPLTSSPDRKHRNARRPRRTRPCRRRLWLECLEDRTAPAGSTFATATPLAFTALQSAQVSHFLSNPQEVDLYQVALDAGDRVHVAVSAQTAGSGLQSWLQVFGPDHSSVALN